MAKRVTTQLVDDLDGSAIDDESGETIEFSADGIDYSIDLKTKNANEFRKKLDYYIGRATRVGGRKRKPASATPASTGTPTKRDPEQARTIRQWAFDQGYELSSRGRIPAEIEEAYTAAH